MTAPDDPSPAPEGDIAETVAADLPFLRRYARALTGAQEAGDRYAIAALETIVADPSSLAAHSTPRVGLYAVFHRIWTTSGAVVEEAEAPESLLEQRAQWRLHGLSPNSREAVLLHTIEGFSVAEIAEILSVTQGEADELLARAREEMGKMVTGKVLVIEDEAIIAMDLEGIVAGMGHDVVEIARTRAEAVSMGRDHAPDLILADIQLADKSSGIDAVNDLLAELGEVPVIFITAFPERLLTGERPEPAFLIAKPYSEEQVRAAVSQAMFFASTESLMAAG